MWIDIKALIVVLAIAIAVFAIAKPICVRYMDTTAYNRRRNIWFALTVVGFASPSIWVYAAIAMPVMFVAAQRDENPLALYAILLFVVPNAGVTIPVIGIGAGGNVGGQVLVMHDLLGLTDGHLPKFVRTYTNSREIWSDAVRRFATDVRTRAFPSVGEEYGMPDGVVAPGR